MKMRKRSENIEAKATIDGETYSIMVFCSLDEDGHLRIHPLAWVKDKKETEE